MLLGDYVDAVAMEICKAVDEWICEEVVWFLRSSGTVRLATCGSGCEVTMHGWPFDHGGEFSKIKMYTTFVVEM
jgi:hypothetical protein